MFFQSLVAFGGIYVLLEIILVFTALAAFAVLFIVLCLFGGAFLFLAIVLFFVGPLCSGFQFARAFATAVYTGRIKPSYTRTAELWHKHHSWRQWLKASWSSDVRTIRHVWHNREAYVYDSQVGHNNCDN